MGEFRKRVVKSFRPASGWLQRLVRRSRAMIHKSALLCRGFSTVSYQPNGGPTRALEIANATPLFFLLLGGGLVCLLGVVDAFLRLGGVRVTC